MNERKGGNCYHCGNALGPLDYARTDSCSKCGRDTHVCRNCGFHDRAYNNECKESQAERVVDKEHSNFCDYFDPKAGGPSAGVSSKDALKAAAEALFKKK